MTHPLIVAQTRANEEFAAAAIAAGATYVTNPRAIAVAGAFKAAADVLAAVADPPEATP